MSSLSLSTSFSRPRRDSTWRVSARIRSSALGLAVLWVILAIVPAPKSHATEERIIVAASERYHAGRVHRFVLGGGYRDLWQMPVELPLLDLANEGGGLTPTGRFGGLQTAVLGFKAANRKLYTFRGTDKDPSAVLDAMLQNTIVQALVQDQMAAQHPAGPLVAGVLTEAAGVLTIHERLVVMPDDPRLGEYRQEFAGMVGTFFEYPQPASESGSGFAEATAILDHEELYARLEQGADVVVDIEAFLRARLMDLLIGDFDRHRKQWRWAEVPGTSGLKPIPEDRDQAFVRYDGVGQRVMKIYIPILQRYDAEYPFIKGLTLHGWEQDRWLLPGLSWPQWESIVSDLQARLTDEVIDRAVAQLPIEYQTLDGERLRHDVRGRRDNLPEAARRFYLHLAREVDVQLSDANDDVRVERDDEGRMRVEVRDRASSGPDERVLFARVFEPNETNEVRLKLRGGDDRVIVSGDRRQILLRVVAGEGQKQVDDTAAGGTRIYDEAGNVEVRPGPGTRVSKEPYTLPPSDSGFVDVENVPPRDWGSDTLPFPEFGFQPDVGVFLGAAVAHTRYGFRKHPWSSKHSLGLGWAFEANAPRVRYQGLFRPENSDLVAGLDLEYSGIEVLRFYGFGNNTNDNGSDRSFRVRNQIYRASGRLTKALLDEKVRVSAGPLIQVSRTSKGRRLIDRIDPYGNNDFGLIGAQVNFQFDTRKSLPSTKTNLELPFHTNPAAGYPTSGIFLDLSGRFQPPVWDVEDSYGSIEGSISGYQSIGESQWATLALRVGGMETFGKTPYFDFAYIGGGRFFSGSSSNRGFRTRRLAGDSSVYANVDLRVVLGRLTLVVPGDVGVQGFFDVGRVFYHDESSDNWYPSGGAGVWFSPLVRTNTISVSVAHSPEETLAYLRIGFHY